MNITESLRWIKEWCRLLPLFNVVFAHSIYKLPTYIIPNKYKKQQEIIYEATTDQTRK